MTDTPAWRHSWTKRAQAGLVPAVLNPVLEFLYGTCTWQYTGREHLDRLRAVGAPHILAFWHGRILTSMMGLRDLGYKPLISENFDGEWIEAVSGHFGWGSVRGSSSRGGARALIQMKRQLLAGENMAFTPDGPRGPERQVQPGVIWLARATGAPIIAVRSEASRGRRLSSWDHHLVPSPGATVTIDLAPPLYVPADADADAVDAKRRDLEELLNAPVRV
jgi:lysophospholipid acyltransferase (LPLAT)-like uncharacterized protein